MESVIMRRRFVYLIVFEEWLRYPFYPITLDDDSLFVSLLFCAEIIFAMMIAPPTISTGCFFLVSM